MHVSFVVISASTYVYVITHEVHLHPYDVIPQEEDEESDEEGPIYNPLNLPLGWDGKPIPYWLYKLHGLGVEFKCEICGDFSYKGRRCVCVCV